MTFLKGAINESLAAFRVRLARELRKEVERVVGPVKDEYIADQMFPLHPNCRCTVTYKKEEPYMPGRRIEIRLGKDCRAIMGSPHHREIIQVDEHTSVPGLIRPGDVRLEGVLPSTLLSLKRAWCRGEPAKFTIGGLGGPTGPTYEFTGFVHSITNDTVSILPTGPMKEKKAMAKKMPAGLKRYYVGSNNVTADWTHEKLSEAVAHATKLVEKEGYEETFVVEIKRVVRRKQQPVVVEAFK